MLPLERYIQVLPRLIPTLICLIAATPPPTQTHKEGLENAKAELLKAEKEGNYEKAGELRWSKIPALEELVEVDDSPENKAKLKVTNVIKFIFIIYFI